MGVFHITGFRPKPDSVLMAETKQQLIREIRCLETGLKRANDRLSQQAVTIGLLTSKLAGRQETPTEEKNDTGASPEQYSFDQMPRYGKDE